LVLLIALTLVENQIVFLKPGNGGNEKKYIINSKYPKG